MRLALLGDPVAHSLSPRLQNAALRGVGLPGDYVARRVDAVGVEAAFADIRSGRLDGANVTMPHKQLAARFCDGLASTAARSGAVNTLVRIGTAVVGHNTDVDGVTRAWRFGGLPRNGPVLVLGAGGAAAAALLALDGWEVSVAARDEERARALVERVAVEARIVGWGIGARGAVIVNATPLGMTGERLPEGLVANASGLLDMAYGPVSTPAVGEAAALGLPVADGMAMLMGQAVESFRLWTGRVAPEEAMRAAIRATVEPAEVRA